MLISCQRRVDINISLAKKSINNGPEVTINEAQSEIIGSCNFTAPNSPIHSLNIEYRVTFSQAIDPTTFTTADITNNGTGGATAMDWTIENCGDDQNFKLIASNIVGDGTIVPTISDSLISDTEGILNQNSTSTDNSVTFLRGWYQEAYIKPANNDTNDEFGSTIFLYGDTLSVGVYKEDSNQTTITNGTSASSDNSNDSSGAVYIYKRTGIVWAQEAYIKTANNNASDEFGSIVSLHGDTLAVGAPQESSNQTTITNGTGTSSNNSNGGSGAVYVYKRSGANWTQEAYIKAVNNNTNDKFGTAVSLYGDTLAVGAPQESSNLSTITNGTSASSNNSNIWSGAIYLYKRTGTLWAQQAYIKASNNNGNAERFGRSLSLQGDTLAAGSSYENSNQTTITNGTSASSDTSNVSSGAVYIYKRTGTLWAQEAYIKASNNDAGDSLGSSVSIQGDTLAVGAPDEDSNQTTITNGTGASSDDSNITSGAVYIYRRTGVIWAQEAYVKAANNDSNDSFGTSVSINGNTLAVGAPQEDSNQTTITNGTGASSDDSNADSGAVYIYKRTGVTWAQEAYVKAANNDSNDFFGTSVSINGDTLAVGAPQEDSNQTTITNGTGASSDDSKAASGAVYIYRNRSRLFEVGDLLSSVTSGSVTLDWLKSGGSATSYFIAYQMGATAPVNCTSGTTVNLGDVNSYTISSLLANTSYSYRICSSDGSIFSDGMTGTITTNQLNVTVNQAVNATVGSCSFSAPSDPSSVTGIEFRIVFSDPIDTTSFNSADINNAGTGGGTTLTWSLTNCGDNKNFKLVASTIVGDGTIVPRLSAGTVTDPSGNSNLASTSTDNSVTYVAPPTGWYQEAYIKASNPDISDSFGGSISLNGDTLLVSSKFEDSNQTSITNGSTSSTDNSKSSSGAVYIYKRTGSSWTQEAYLKAVNGDSGDWFGHSISISKDTASISAFQEQSNQTTITDGATASSNNSNLAAGAVYIYKRTGATWAQEAYIKSVNNNMGDNFGTSVEIDNNTLAVSANNEASNQITITNGPTASSNNSNSSSGAVYIYTRTGTSWSQQAYIKASNNDASDQFGYWVSIDVDTLAVGAIYESSNQTTITNGTTASSDNSNNGSGAVYVYKRSGTSWAQEAYIKASNNDANDWFGRAVSVNAERLAVGAPFESSNQSTITNGTSASSNNSNSSSGAAYVYKRTGINWAQEAYIKAPNPDSNDNFGNSIQLNGDTLVVGAPGESSNQTTITNGTTASSNNSNGASGAAYIFKRSGTTWSQEAYLKAVNNDSSDSFGRAVSLSGDTVAVGANNESSNQSTITNGSTASSDNSASGAGAAYIYRNRSRLFEINNLAIAFSGVGYEAELSWSKGGGSATGYVIAYQVGTTPPADCSSGITIDAGDVSTYTVDTGADGDYAFRICATDGSSLTEGRTGYVTIPP